MKKNIIFLTMLMICSSCYIVNCSQAHQPGGYTPDVSVLPGGGVPKEYIAKKGFLNHENSSGWETDMSGAYTNSRYLVTRFWDTIREPFTRETSNSNLTSACMFITYKSSYMEENNNRRLIHISCFNVYEDTYTENNKNNAVIRFELGNWYKKGKKINTINSSQYGISIWEDQAVYVKPEADESSRRFVLPINKNVICFLVSAIAAAKYGIDNLYILPIAIAGGWSLPVVLPAGIGVGLCMGAVVVSFAWPLLLIMILNRL